MPDIQQVMHQIDKMPMQPEDMPGENTVDESGLDASIPEEREPANPNDVIIRVKIDDTKKRKLMDFIKDEMTCIESDYSAFGYFEKVQKSEDEFNIVKNTDNTAPKGSNRKVVFLQMFSDIFTGQAVRQTDTASPNFLMQLDTNVNYKDKTIQEWDGIISSREKHLDYVMRYKTELSRLHSEAAYPRGYWQGTSMIKNPFIHKEETYSEKVTYDTANLDAYDKKYAEELLNPNSREFKDRIKIQAGQTVQRIEETTKVCTHASKPYRTPLDKFYARLWVKDLNDCSLVAEQLEMNWIQVNENFESGYYDEEEYEDFKLKNNDYQRKKYDDIYEAIVQCDIEDEDVIRKYQVIFDSTSEQILRIVRYPYRHNRCYYIPYSARPRDNSWLGYMAWERLEDTISAANAFLNATINEFALAHHPVIITNSTQDMGRVDINADDDISVIRLNDPAAKWDQMKFEYSPMDRAAFLDRLIRFAELYEGISASLASGGETPDDPRAPAAKTAMKMQASHTRMEDMIVNLQRSDEELALQTDSNLYQFPEYVGESTYGYYSDSGYGSLAREAYNYNVKYVCHGSKLAFNKAADLQSAVATEQFVKAEYPEIYAMPEVKKVFLEVILNNTQGSMNTNKQKLLKYMDLVIKSKNEAAEKQKALEAEAEKRGINIDEIRQNPQAAMARMKADMMKNVPMGQGGQGNGGTVGIPAS